MAMTEQQKLDSYRFFAVAFGAATGVEYMNQLDEAYSAGMTTQEIVNVFTTKPEFLARYPAFFTNQQFAIKLVDDVVQDSASDAAKAQAVADIVGALNAGWSRGDVIYTVFNNLAEKDPEDPVWGGTATLLANQVTVAAYVTEVKLLNTTDLPTLQAVLEPVTQDSDVSSPEAIEELLSGTPVTEFTLTDGIDNLTGTTADDTFSAPVVQNDLGGVINTLETGDTLDGGAGVDTLNVDLTQVGSNSVTGGPAISPVTTNIEIVNLRQQYTATDTGVNSSDLDAELMSGVEQFWTVNSRADVQIEDIRQLPEVTAIGMRQTDPGVGYFVYFDPAQLAEDRTNAGNSSLTLTLINNEDPESELADFPVSGVGFKLDGVQYVVESDAMGEADTYADFAAALEEALAEDPALADLTVTLNADNTITITDPAGGEFEALGYTWVDGIAPPAGQLTWDLTVGDPVVSEEPISTTVVLDAVGRSSQGGTLDIGSMGDGGIATFNIVVDRSSWLTSAESREDFGGGDRHLETVNLTSAGANGNLAIGDETDFLDGRVVGGLTDVRVVNGAAFEGELNIGVVITEDSIDRYLDPATAEVAFTYTAGDQDDIFTIDVDDDVSVDPDFTMTAAMGDGDDRLNVGVATARKVSVAGGDGDDTIAVSRSHGTTSANTFKSFTGFEVYEVEGDSDTSHDFTSMPGLTSVVVATEGGADTRLIDLPAGQGVIVSGKNQTLGNSSNDDQDFGEIRVSGADGESLTVTLQNTARVDGNLSVDSLLVDNQVLLNGTVNASAVRTLEIVSAGARQTTNEVDEIDALLVNTFNLSGTQDLEVRILTGANYTAAASQRGNLVVDGSELTGDLELNINGDLVTEIDGTANRTVTLTGTDGDGDRLTFNGAVTTTNDTTISGFETVRFGDAFIGEVSSGEFDGTNVTGVSTYEVDNTDADLALFDLRGTETVVLNTYNDVANATESIDGNVSVTAGSRGASNTLTVDFDYSREQFPTPTIPPLDSELSFDDTLSVNNYRTIDLDFFGYANRQYDWNVDLELLGYTAGGDDFANYATTLNIAGGAFDQVGTTRSNVDTLVMDNLAVSLTRIDLSEWKGDFEGSFGEVLDENGAAYVVQADFATNTTIVVNDNNFTWDNTIAGAQNSTITTFEFTADAYSELADWTIEGFNAFNSAGVSLSNVSILDLSALGVDTLADIVITDDGGGNTVITSNEGLDFEILLVGVATGDISNENFKFAS